MTIELAILSMCIISLIWNAINTYLIVRKKRIYEIPVEEIEDNLQPTAFEPIKDEEIKRQRKEQFKFSMIGLTHGEKIVSTINKDRSAQVYDENHIMYCGEITSLSTAAIKIYKETNPNTNRRKITMKGPDYWTYKGETLDHMRKRMENKE